MTKFIFMHVAKANFCFGTGVLVAKFKNWTAQRTYTDQAEWVELQPPAECASSGNSGS